MSPDSGNERAFWLLYETAVNAGIEIIEDRINHEAVSTGHVQPWSATPMRRFMRETASSSYHLAGEQVLSPRVRMIRRKILKA